MNRRVIVHVSGGVVDYVADDGVDVLVLDWDAIEDGGDCPSADDVRRWRDEYRGLLDAADADRLEILADDKNKEARA
jgi:hypothetical protein